MTSSYKQSTYVEGGYLAGGWRYRIQHVVKSDGEPAYTGLLSYNEPTKDLRFVCLSEYSTLEQVRSAVYENLPSDARALLSVMKWPALTVTAQVPS